MTVPPRIVIAAGGTAGHVVPAIAVADALRAEGAQVTFVGGQRAEAELVPQAGYELDTINVEGISRTNPLKAARAVGKAAGRSAPRARSSSAGARTPSWAAAATSPARSGSPPTMAKIPLVLTEADSHLGLTNRLLAKRADRVCLAFPLEGCDGDRYRVTGRPVPPTYADRAHARAQLGIGADETAVLIFGGSLGARSINHAAVEAFKDAPYRVIHVAGTRDYPDLTSPGAHYVLLDYLTPFGVALAAADAAVARSGGSIFELAQYGLPAVLIPYPHATGDHQTTNARWMADAGAARVLPDAELTPERLRAETDACSPPGEMAAAARGSRSPTRRGEIAREVLAAGRAGVELTTPRDAQRSRIRVFPEAPDAAATAEFTRPPPDPL